MRRWLILLLLAVLPLQFTWSVAAAYCQHEVSSKPSHIGHHPHEHHAAPDAAKTKLSDQDTVKANKLLGDNDCGHCLNVTQAVQMHLLSVPALREPWVQSFSAPALQTRDPDRLERPNWRPA